MEEPGFFSNPDKGPAAAPQISNEILILIELYLRMEPRYTLVHNVDFVL